LLRKFVTCRRKKFYNHGARFEDREPAVLDEIRKAMERRKAKDVRLVMSDRISAEQGFHKVFSKIFLDMGEIGK
jgi:hypothetical protein